MTQATEAKILDRVQKLINKAVGTDNPAEAAAFHAKAEELMLEYRISELQLEMRGAQAPSVKGQEPVVRRMRDITVEETYEEARNGGTEFNFYLGSLWGVVMRHFGVKVTKTYISDDPGAKEVVGFPADLEFAEMMFVSLKLHMIGEMFPHVNTSISWEENIANLKDMGLKWRQIHERMSRANHPQYPFTDMPWERRFGVKFTSVYRSVCESQGRERTMTSSPRTWRDDFLAGYLAEITNRLAEARRGSAQAHDNLPALLADREDQDMEFIYQMYPERRPHPDDCKCDRCEARRKPMKMSGPGSRGGRGNFRYRNMNAYGAGRRRAKTADLSGSGAKVSQGSKGAIQR